jgi:tetratricopeptide (TPR) repeat protein
MMELFPKDPQPPYLVGAIRLVQGRLAEARQAFVKSLEISPNYLPAAERLVDLDIADKQYAAAMDRVQKLVDHDPKQAQAWAIKGKIYLAQRDFTHAEADLLKAIELDPKLEAAHLLLARLYVDSNKQERAIERLDAFVDKNRDEKDKTVPALLQLAMIQQNLKYFSDARDDARDAYEKLLAIAPTNASALNNLAVLYSDHLGQPDKAYDLAKKARAAAPNDPHITDTLGWILYKKGDYGSALPLLQESASKLAGQPVSQIHLGMAQYMLGAEDPARLALQRATETTADFPGKDEARRRLAMLAIDVQTANAADVKTELEDHLRERPNDPVALLRLGGVQEREGALDQAVKIYEKIIDGDPQFAPATRRLALLYSQRSPDDPKSYDLATQARQAYPGDPDIAGVLGILNYRRGYYPQSAELLKEATAKQNDNAALFYYLGRASHQLKQWSECDSALKRAISLDPLAKLADQAKTALVYCSAQLESRGHSALSERRLSAIREAIEGSRRQPQR